MWQAVLLLPFLPNKADFKQNTKALGTDHYEKSLPTSDDFFLWSQSCILGYTVGFSGSLLSEWNKCSLAHYILLEIFEIFVNFFFFFKVKFNKFSIVPSVIFLCNLYSLSSFTEDA